MKILIDNLDGLGFLDYTPLVHFDTKSEIFRQLNKITSCTFKLFIEPIKTHVPTRLNRVQIISGDSSILFTGYIKECLSSISVGAGLSGPVYQFSVNAVSDDAALDFESSTSQALLIGQSLQQDWNILNTLIIGSPVTMTLPPMLLTAGKMNLSNGMYWTEAAAGLTESTRMAYHVNDTGFTVIPLGQFVHVISPDDPGLTFTSPSVSGLQWLANDVTVCGNEEPTAYVTEIFQGDGATKSFELFTNPFIPTNKQKTSIQDSFQGNTLNSRIWMISDPAAHLALTAEGLACEGGSGKDGETTIASTQLIELGGTITLEGTGVQFSNGSDGIVLGFYTDIISVNTCFAGFTVSSAGNTISLAAQVNGVVAGETFVLNASHIYTLRLKVFSSEMERVEQSYFYSIGTGSAFYGGGAVENSGQVEFSIQDIVSGIPGAPVIIYSAPVDFIPTTCRLGIFNSGNLICSLKSVQLLQTAPLRVGLGNGSNVPINLIIGNTAEGSDCIIRDTGVLDFYPANIPTVNSFIYATYRAKARAVARRVQSSAPGGLNQSFTATWLGSVVSPSAWSSRDCNNAALALLSTQTSLSTSLKGFLKSNSQNVQKDIWPGDTLSVGPYPDSTYRGAIVRSVSIILSSGSPDSSTYKVEFADEQAQDLNLHFSHIVPENVLLPQQPTPLDKALPSLIKLNVVNVTGTSITLDTGEKAPLNGGFEVRRRDNTFGLGGDSDLVLRSTTSNISIPRIADVEQYYVRTYDACVPPNYSLFSAAVFVNIPM